MERHVELKFRAFLNGFMYYDVRVSSVGQWSVDTLDSGYDINWREAGIVQQFIVHDDDDDIDIYEGDIILEKKHGKVIRTFIAEDIRTLTREYDIAGRAVWEYIGNICENPEYEVEQGV